MGTSRSIPTSGITNLQIEDVAFGGKGVGRVNGRVVFVPFTLEGERVAARITREKKQFAEADLERVLEASPRRIEPLCPYFGRCGGCSYQHIQYEHQLALKQRQVEEVLRRIGRIAAPPMRAIVPSPKPYAYRNRVTVHAEEGVIGYYRREAHRLIDVESCPIAAPQVNDALAHLRARKPRDGHYTLRAHEGPRVFAQTNDEVAEALVQHIDDLLREKHTLLIDAYCGAGFFAKRLLHKFERVIGIEWDRFAIDAAASGATAKETYIAGAVETELRRLLETNPASDTVVIVDPPATGLPAATTELLRAFPPATLIYVSCNPATLARDLGRLRERFGILSVTPLDMFPQTAEIECVVHLQPATAAASDSNEPSGSSDNALR